jgi:hypothetical protein
MPVNNEMAGFVIRRSAAWFNRHTSRKPSGIARPFALDVDQAAVNDNDTDQSVRSSEQARLGV